MSGRLKLDSLAGPIIGWIDSDWDWLTQSILEALKELSPEKTLELAASRYQDFEWGGRFSLASVFENLRFETFDNRIHQIFEWEREDDVRVNLAVALAHYNTPSSTARARCVYEECPDDPERFAVAEIIYCHAAIIGEVLPEAEAWRSRMEEMLKRSRVIAHSDDCLAEETFQDFLPQNPKQLVESQWGCSQAIENLGGIL